MGRAQRVPTTSPHLLVTRTRTGWEKVTIKARGITAKGTPARKDGMMDINNMAAEPSPRAELHVNEKEGNRWNKNKTTRCVTMRKHDNSKREEGRE